MNTSAIVKFLEGNPLSSKEEIREGIGFSGSDSTLKRLICQAVQEGAVSKSGAGKNTRYSRSVKVTPTRKYPDGIQTFEKIIQGGYAYVDKTDLVWHLAQESSTYVFLSRPRRFGKSLLVSTLKAYFEGRKELFKGLSIEKLESKWEIFPVIRLDLSTAADALDKQQLYLKLGNILGEIEEQFGLQKNDTLPGERLYSIVKRVYEISSKQVVLLIDEYDAPLLGALFDESREEEFKLVIKELFAPIKKLDPYLHFTFLSGITKFSQLSIFSTLNNLKDISLSDKFATLCGFTDEEIQGVFGDEISALARERGTGKKEILTLLKQNYDGYHFSPECVDTYNPFSILRTFSNMKIGNWWFASGTPAVLFNALKKFDTDIYDIDGVEVKESTFSQPAESVTNAASLFYQSGYLTIKSYSPVFDSYVLTIPNAEVRSGLMDNLLPLVYGKSQIESQNVAIRFKRALLEENVDQAMEILKGFFASIPYPEFGKNALDTAEKKEAYFKRLFYVVFSFMNVQMYTEIINSEGRTDAVMYLGDTVYVVEAKLDAGSAQEALKQIDSRGYATRFAGSKLQVKRLGINFSSKTRTIQDWRIV